MKLSAKTWHYWLYTHYFSKYDVPNNLCPYFWKVVLAIILFFPTNIIALPWIIVKFFVSIYDNEKYEYPRFFKDFGQIIGMYIAILALFCMIGMWWHIPKKRQDGDGVFVFGCICWTLILVALLGLWIAHLKEKRDDKRYKQRQLEGYVPKVPKPNIFIAFIRAKYEKNCPIIEWTDKE